MRLETKPLSTAAAGGECCQQDFFHYHRNPKLVFALVLGQVVNIEYMKKHTSQKSRKEEEENHRYAEERNLSNIYRFSGCFIPYVDYSCTKITVRGW